MSFGTETKEPIYEGYELTVRKSLTVTKVPRNGEEKHIKKLKNINHEHIVPFVHFYDESSFTVTCLFNSVGMMNISSFYKFYGEKGPTERDLIEVFLQFIDAMLEFDKVEHDPNFFIPTFVNENKTPKILITTWIKTEYNFDRMKEHSYYWQITEAKNFRNSPSKNNAGSAITFAFALFSGVNTNELSVPTLHKIKQGDWTSTKAEKIKKKSPEVLEYLKKQILLALTINDSNDRHELPQMKKWFENRLKTLETKNLLSEESSS